MSLALFQVLQVDWLATIALNKVEQLSSLIIRTYIAIDSEVLVGRSTRRKTYIISFVITRVSVNHACPL